MYTIKHAAALAGVSVELLRAWERRYGIVSPIRTAAGYRLYDDAAIDRLRTMRALIAAGWSPRTAAEAIVSEQAPPVAIATIDASDQTTADAGSRTDLIEQFVSAAQQMDGTALSRTLDAIFARGSFERVVVDVILPALARTGDEWAAGRLTVAAEHAASSAVLRRLGASLEAAGIDPPVEAAIVFGLPPGSSHELGLLAFAAICRRGGLPALYVGANLPGADWLSAASTARGVVIGVPTRGDRRTAARLAGELREARPAVVVALGGPAAPAVEGCLRLSEDMLEAASQLRSAIADAGRRDQISATARVRA